MTRRVGLAVLVWAFGVLVAAFVAVSVSTALETRRLRERRRQRRRSRTRCRQVTHATSSSRDAAQESEGGGSAGTPRWMVRTTYQPRPSTSGITSA